jgi:serine/threonine-protein kinase
VSSGGGDDSISSKADSFFREVAAAPEVPLERDDHLANLAAGQIIAGRYRLERALGEGGMGVVWAARHAVTRKPVALKFLKSAARERPETRQRFLREARAASAVRHPSVVDVHDVLELEDGSPVMVMDLLEGETLAARLAREHTLPLAEVARIMVPVCAAVGSAHALGIVHRDLKPDNVFLCAQGGGAEAVKVLDFGIAKLTATEGDAAQSGSVTNTGVLLGTPFYMAPEQMFGERNIDHRADLWAIGVILYEALTGGRPTHGSNVGQVFKMVAKEEIVPLRKVAPTLPEAVLDLVAKLLQHHRERRPADLREVVSVLSAYTSAHAEPFGAPKPIAESVAISPTGSVKPRNDSDEAHAATVDASPQPRRWLRPVVLGAAVVAVASGVAVVSLRQPAPSPAVAAPAAVPPTPSIQVAVVPASATTTAAAADPAPSASVITSAAASSAATIAPPPATRRSGTPRPHAEPSATASAAATPPAPSATKPAATTPKMSEDL